ncbi:EamA-like transporter family protein [Kushneria sinocarnis]|uniref:EamA-like transporter family protein n=1 Tax=Kushneria sinocarnis TaxID=595502 RepID=A0A420WUQ6_9GAMM|nr:DMT family transporter [Kushneria sinocarnis]RKQ97177.1 EamA-like transporter family protein [Kushneria sinocarnis]
MLDLWILLTLLAAGMQAWRNALQKQLSRHVSIAGVTLARFFWAWPLSVLYVFMLYRIRPAPWPDLSLAFMATIAAAALGQIAATALMVMLFRQRNYAAGVGLAKSEALLAALLGVLVFGATISPLGWCGILIGAVALWLMRGATPDDTALRPLMIGLASGLCFALTSLWVRHATQLQPALPFLHAAGWVLTLTIGMQWLTLVGWLAWRDRPALVLLWQRPRDSARVSLTSLGASLGWFTAMSLQDVALVKTLGQVEVLFTLLIARCWFREPITRRDRLGLVLIVIGALCVMWP